MRGAHPVWFALALAGASGVVAGLCFPPFDLGPVVLIALVPLLWTWRDARPHHAALYGFAFGVGVLRRRARVDPLLRRASRSCRSSSVMALAIAIVGALVGRASHGAGIASPLLTAAVWVVLEALRGRAPLGGFPWADLGVTPPRPRAGARAREPRGHAARRASSSSRSTASLLDRGLALRAHETARDRRWRRWALVGVLVFVVGRRRRPLRSDRPPAGCAFALLQGDDEELPLARADQPAAHRQAPRARASSSTASYDLIVFPESALDTDPQIDPEPRGRGSPTSRPSTTRACS